jgi:hypothetical protein
MLRRLLLGLAEGLALGLALGVAFARVIGGMASPGGAVALLLGALAGFATGLVAGRPVWARNAKTEALLKAAAGAFAGAGLSFAFRRWLSVSVDLSSFSLGVGPAGHLPALTVPAVTTLLALFFELDDDTRTATAPPVSAAERRRVDDAGADSARSDELDVEHDDIDRRHEKR